MRSMNHFFVFALFLTLLPLSAFAGDELLTCTSRDYNLNDENGNEITNRQTRVIINKKKMSSIEMILEDGKPIDVKTFKRVKQYRFPITPHFSKIERLNRGHNIGERMLYELLLTSDMRSFRSRIYIPFNPDLISYLIVYDYNDDGDRSEYTTPNFVSEAFDKDNNSLGQFHTGPNPNGCLPE